MEASASEPRRGPVRSCGRRDHFLQERRLRRPAREVEGSGSQDLKAVKAATRAWSYTWLRGLELAPPVAQDLGVHGGNGIFTGWSSRNNLTTLREPAQ